MQEGNGCRTKCHEPEQAAQHPVQEKLVAALLRQLDDNIAVAVAHQKEEDDKAGEVILHTDVSRN